MSDGLPPEATGDQEAEELPQETEKPTVVVVEPEGELKQDPVDAQLETRLQERNAKIYAGLVSLIYLAAPVLYVGFVQAALCDNLGTNKRIANLPSSVYLLMAWFPVLIAWLVPQARLLKPTLVVSYSITAAMGAAVAVVLILGAPPWLIVGSLVAHAAVLGCTNGVAATFNWEALGRGLSEARRGKALSMAFGVGPLFAVAGSLGAQLILDGELFGWRPTAWAQVSYPYSFALLFGASAPIMALGAVLARLYVIPMPATDVQREPFKTAVLGGFKEVCSYRILLIACVAYLLVYCGNMVQNNMSLYTREVVDRPPESLVGYQLALRFGVKMLAGLLLGWILARTNPKVPLLITVGLQIAGVLWVLFVPGYWFLVAFGINGAGELFGVYYFNYPLCCSPKSQMRRNIAFLMLISAPVGLAPYMYGWISDVWSLRASFWVALGILLFTTALVAKTLPSHPKPRPEDMRAADLAEETA